MSNAFDMELFLTGVLTGSHATRQRHIHQAKAIQVAIAERWQLDNPRAWHRKHLNWFLVHHLSAHADSTRYYYLLTAQLIAKRRGKAWKFNRYVKTRSEGKACVRPLKINSFPFPLFRPLFPRDL